MSIVTVSSPAALAQRRLCSRDALKVALGIPDTASDARLDGIIDQASAAIAAYCRRSFAAETVTETLRGLETDGEVLLLARRPVTALTSVTADGQLLSAGASELDGPAGLLYRLGGDAPAIWFASKVVVVYAAGYSLPEQAPADLAQACIMLSTSLWHGSGRDAAVRSEATDGVATVSYFGADGGPGVLPEAVRTLLAPHREPLL